MLGILAHISYPLMISFQQWIFSIPTIHMYALVKKESIVVFMYSQSYIILLITGY